jgi:polysaccharide pyruvyl transferase WcaK-like protein
MGGNPLNIQLVGWYGKHNVGDEAYKLAFPILFPAASCSFSTFPTSSCPVTILGGGDCVSPEVLTKFAKTTGRKHIMSVTISSDHPAEAFKGFDTITVRDKASSDRLSAIGVPHKVSPDATFALTPDAANGTLAIKRIFQCDRRELYEKVVVVVVNSHLLRDQDARQAAAFEKLSHDLAYVCDWTNASFLFIPFGSNAPWDDRASNAYVHSRPKWWKKNLTLYDRLDPQTVLDVIAASQAVISFRLHSSIFATVAGVPFVDVTHNHKNPDFLRSIDRSDWAVPYITFDAERCKRLVDRFLTDDSDRDKLKDVALQQRLALFEASKRVRID